MLVSRYYFGGTRALMDAMDAAGKLEGMPLFADHENHCLVVPFADGERTESALAAASVTPGTFVRGAEAAADEAVLAEPFDDRHLSTDPEDIDATYVSAWGTWV